MEAAVSGWLGYYEDGLLAGNLLFSEAEDASLKLVDRLFAQGVEVGDRVIVSTSNPIETAIAHLALREAGMIAVPLPPDESGVRLRRIVSDSGARAAITQAGVSKIPGPPPARELSQVATLVYTSGTTGEPKGVCLGWPQWESNARALIEHHGITTDTVLASPLPLYHCNALGFSMITTYLARCRWIAFNRTGPELLNVVNREGVEILSLVPSLLHKLLASNFDWTPHPDLRYVVTAAAPLPVGLLRAALDMWGVRVVQGYGLSESTNFSCTVPVDLPEEVYRKVMFPHPSIGVALPGVEISVEAEDEEGHVGQLFVRSESNFLGYWPVQDSSTQFIPTGDLGYYKTIDGVRFYYLVGREKEQINRSGEKVHPAMLEEELRELGLDGDFATIPLPDPVRGEEVALLTTSDPDPKVLSRVPWRRRPKTVMLVDEIPRTATGKIRRREARERLVAQIEKEGGG